MFSFFTQRVWFAWSILGSILIIGGTWYKVQVDVRINEWFGEFYDLIQTALSAPNSVNPGEFYGYLWSFGQIAGIYIVMAVILDFFTKHYIFRWRTAMNAYYTEQWHYIRDTEGASQRIQEDTRIFAGIMQGLGVAFLRSVMTLFAFLPVLYGLSANIVGLPVLGEVTGSLIYVAVIFALLGTVGLALLGIKLPGLEYNNQKVEARYRKELVLGEDDDMAAQPPMLTDLFGRVRQNYFRLFWHYLYFDIGKWSYLQFGVLVPYLALGPSIIGAAFTLGVMQQIVRAFDRVVSSFQFLVSSWPTIVELLSVWKRLHEFEQKIKAAKKAAAVHA